jgi:hypothetical protein
VRNPWLGVIGESREAANLAPRGALCPPCEIQPINERQLRPLAVLEPTQQFEVWKEDVRSADGEGEPAGATAAEGEPRGGGRSVVYLGGGSGGGQGPQ